MRASASWLLFIWVCLLGLAPAGPAWGQSVQPQWLWAQTGGSTAPIPWRGLPEMGNRLEVDAAGNSYVMGGYTDSARFGNVRRHIHPGHLRITDAEDVFLALTSYPPGDQADDLTLAAFRAAIADAFAKGGGALVADRQVGLFLSRKA